MSSGVCVLCQVCRGRVCFAYWKECPCLQGGGTLGVSFYPGCAHLGVSVSTGVCLCLEGVAAAKCLCPPGEVYFPESVCDAEVCVHTGGVCVCRGVCVQQGCGNVCTPGGCLSAGCGHTGISVSAGCVFTWCVCGSPQLPLTEWPPQGLDAAVVPLEPAGGRTAGWPHMKHQHPNSDFKTWGHKSTGECVCPGLGSHPSLLLGFPKALRATRCLLKKQDGGGGKPHRGDQLMLLGPSAPNTPFAPISFSLV